MELSVASYFGQFGTPAPFGSPVFAKFVSTSSSLRLAACPLPAQSRRDACRASQKRTQYRPSEMRRCRMILARQRRQFKVVAIHRRMSRVAMRLDPLPGSKRDELVSPEIDRGSQCLRVCIAGIELQKFGRAVAELLFRKLRPLCSRHRIAWPRSCLHRHSILPAAEPVPALPVAYVFGTGSVRNVPSTTGEKLGAPFLAPSSTLSRRQRA